MGRRKRSLWTAEDICAYGARMPAVAAMEAVYGYGETKAREILASGDHDLPVIKCGRRCVVPTSAVCKILQLGS
jgi:hypothetical protein